MFTELEGLLGLGNQESHTAFVMNPNPGIWSALND